MIILKRFFDIVFSLIGLVLVSPLFLIIAILIKLEDKGLVFYQGVRVGRSEKPFKMFKFRTMVVNADRIGGPSTADDDPRITGTGKFLRKYKLDELPQLINVLKGEMSFVGPRPEVPEEVELYREEHRRAILSVQPGMTDYSSIKFHNEGEILKGSEDPHQMFREKIQPEKIRLGLKYVKDHSFWIDLKVIFQTLKTVVRG